MKGQEPPLEMLHACHSRIERQCAALQGLVAHLATRGADSDARGVAASLMRFFDAEVRDHHADEEQDLFPALIESMSGSDAVCLRELLAGLAAEHRELAAHWRIVRAALGRVVAGDSVALESAGVQALVDLYRRHIEREESELLPMAARLLSDGDVERIGRAMRERRGIAAQG
jgi:hemerythrin-like domain-containing protein